MNILKSQKPKVLTIALALLFFSNTCVAQTTASPYVGKDHSDGGVTSHGSSSSKEAFEATKGSTTKGNPNKPISEGSVGDAVEQSNSKNPAFDSKNEQAKPDGSKSDESHGASH